MGAHRCTIFLCIWDGTNIIPATAYLPEVLLVVLVALLPLPLLVRDAHNLHP